MKLREKYIIISELEKPLSSGRPFYCISSLPCKIEEMKKIIKDVIFYKIIQENINCQLIEALIFGFCQLSFFIEDEIADELNNSFKMACDDLSKCSEAEGIFFRKMHATSSKKWLKLYDEIYEFLSQFPEGKKWVEEVKILSKNNKLN